MLFYRIILIAVCLYLPQFGACQHQAFHWYTFQSLLPLNAEEGKEALVLIRENTSDSLSGFTDKNDYFSIATKEEEDLDFLMDILNASGFYLIDITNPRLENQYYVRASKGYQYAMIYCMEPDRFAELTPDIITLTQQAKAALSEEFQLLVANSNRFILKEN
jgi:hypothetical protein